MSETREDYNITMQPGLELDIEVVKAMHRVNVKNYPDLSTYTEAIEKATGDAPPFSTNPTVAMGAWEWLEKNNPWKETSLMLGRDFFTEKPAVIKWDDPYSEWEAETIAEGDTYPHAISLAVVKAAKVKEVKK